MEAGILSWRRPFWTGVRRYGPSPMRYLGHLSTCGGRITWRRILNGSTRCRAQSIEWTSRPYALVDRCIRDIAPPHPSSSLRRVADVDSIWSRIRSSTHVEILSIYHGPGWKLSAIIRFRLLQGLRTANSVVASPVSRRYLSCGVRLSY